MVYMSNDNLLKGWTKATLEEIGEIILGQSPPSSTYNTDGKGLPFYQGKLEFGKTYPTPQKWCTAPKKIATKGDIFISVRAPVGPTNICPEKSCVGRGLAAIRGLCGIQPFFILYLMRAFEYEIAGKGTGTTFNAITGNQLKTFEIPLPPLPEQHRIVAKIEELFIKLDAGKEELLQAKARLKRYRQSVLKAAMEGKLTEDWRKEHGDEIEPASVLLDRILKERREKWETEQLEQMMTKGKTPKDDKWKNKYKESLGPDTSKLSDLPERWVWVTLPQIGELNRGKSKHRPRNASFLFGGRYPFVQTGDIKQANGLIGHHNQTYSEAGLKQSRLWPSGTLCITIAANIADTAILGFDACFPDSVVGFLPEIGQCNIRFVEFFLRTAKEDLERYAPATAQKNINLGTLKDLVIPFPPLAEQNVITEEIDRYLSVADAVEATIDAELKRSDALRQSILKQAFSGKLVPQDPNDEPAEKLLERIKKEKAKREAEQKANRKTKKQLALFEH